MNENDKLKNIMSHKCLENYVAVCEFIVGEKKIMGLCVNIYAI